jgi:hypothetical protein
VLSKLNCKTKAAKANTQHIRAEAKDKANAKNKAATQPRKTSGLTHPQA